MSCFIRSFMAALILAGCDEQTGNPTPVSGGDDSGDGALTTDSTDATDATDGGKTDDPTDGSDGSNGTDATDATDGMDATDATDATDGSDGTIACARNDSMKVGGYYVCGTPPAGCWLLPSKAGGTCNDAKLRCYDTNPPTEEDNGWITMTPELLEAECEYVGDPFDA